ncbi:3-methyl-2-oxobutanoate hydroxymethyltransferase [Halothiobacillus sp. DCM-1]|uniref:3-methyl-2-oxobutanoate hydroxymethyltransferase n=1 Tax=Halothiobacillus sp. DCM-1 TaxID=3112558 RepID=UPI00325028D7
MNEHVAVLRSLREVWAAKAEGRPISMLTAYDAGFAQQAVQAGVDFLLVGDSLGMVVQGGRDTLGVTIEDMVYHTRLVRRGAPTSLVMADMPFLSDTSPDAAFVHAGALMRAGADIVKIEGGAAKADLIASLTEAGIPVCAHIGLLPQRVRQLGGYRVQGRSEEDAARILTDARALVDAGAAMLLIECVPSGLAERITRQASVPVIGIGAGQGVDGQVLVLQDVLGMNPNPPRFVRDFLRGRGSIVEALAAYVSAVQSRQFPAEHESYA